MSMTVKIITLVDVIDLLPKDIVSYIEFLEEHEDEIRGVYQDKFYQNGGWNGLLDAIATIETREKYVAPDVNINIPGYSDIDLIDLIVHQVFSRV